MENDAGPPTLSVATEKDATIHIVASEASSADLKDAAVLAHIGKKQQFNRIFGFFPILGLSLVLLSTWEAIGTTFASGLYNGGPNALVFGMILAGTGTLALAISLAEMASMCPIAGAQYHWTSILSPPKYSAFITWMQGWITVFAWQATACSVTFLNGTIIQGLIVLNYPDYVFERWHGTLLMFAIILISWVVNVYGIKLLPLLEFVGGICHIAFFLALLIPLVVLSPKSTASEVFVETLNEGGWKSNGVSWCIGLLSVAYSFVGFDGAIHLSEEVRSAATTIPRILILSIVINGVLAFAFLLALLFGIGNIETVLGTATGYPIIAIFYQATGSLAATNAMMSALLIIGFLSAFSILASVSRLTWAFARDGGLCFSRFFAHVDTTKKIPVRALTLVTAVVCLLSLINIGSTVAFNAVLSLSTWALYISYIIPITLLVIKRIRQEKVDFGPFRVRRFGLLVNLYALVYGVFICIFLPFPPDLPVNASNFNYASPVFGGVIILAVAAWFLGGRKVFVGPKREVENTDTVAST